MSCKVTGLVGIYTDPKHLIHYTSDDEVREECQCFRRIERVVLPQF